MTLTEQFQAAAEKVKSLTYRPENSDLLSLYALFKQATEGDVNGDKPSMFDFKAAAKYNAWENLKGLSADDSMQKYIALVDKLLAANG
ncbi:MAG: acyl-CoA-binding protein [Bacteroidia bacterium]|nr:acyl-CoA-binding protein [Bacteroidia bacterium]